MSSTLGQLSYDPAPINRTVTDLKQGMEAAKTLQAEMTGQAVQTATSYAASHQASVAAFVQAGQLLAAGSRDLFRQAAEASRLAYAETLAGLRAVAGATTVKERMELQAALVRTSAIWAVSEGSRFARASIDLTESASAPLQARAVAAAEAMTASKAMTAPQA